jgi:hypothetical protein
MITRNTRRAIQLLDEDYFEGKRYRLGVLSENALDQFESLFDELDDAHLPRNPRTRDDFQKLGIRLGVVSKALLAAAKEAK